MIKVDLTNIQSFLRLPYEAALSPRLRIAHSHLQQGDGIGGEFCKACDHFVVVFVSAFNALAAIGELEWSVDDEVEICRDLRREKAECRKMCGWE